MRYREACGTIVAAVAGLLAFGPARAAAQQVVTNGATVVTVDQVDQYDMMFADLVGMKVSWTFAGGGSGSGMWAALGGGWYGVSGTGSGGDYFSLKGYGTIDTYGALYIDPYVWNLQGHGVSGFTMDALSSNLAFDIARFPTTGTPGSSYGQPYDYYCGVICFFLQGGNADQWNTTATYTQELALNGDPNSPYGDEWGYLNVAFGDPFSSCGTCGVYFSQDVDHLLGGGTPEEIPEPGTMSLLALGLTALAGAGRRRLRRR